jgi:predicted nucleic acid-binding protein
MLILDTSVLSEILRPVPSSGVIDWLESQPHSQLFTTTITQAEILYGVALLPKGARERSSKRILTRRFYPSIHVQLTFTQILRPYENLPANPSVNWTR